MSFILKTIQHARTVVKINEMYLHNIRPAIYRSADGGVSRFIPYKKNYKSGFSPNDVCMLKDQTEEILKDIEKCSKEFPTQYVSLVGQSMEREGVIESIHLCYKPHCATLINENEPNDVY